MPRAVDGTGMAAPVDEPLLPVEPLLLVEPLVPNEPVVPVEPLLPVELPVPVELLLPPEAPPLPDVDVAGPVDPPPVEPEKPELAAVPIPALEPFPPAAEEDLRAALDPEPPHPPLLVTPAEPELPEALPAARPPETLEEPPAVVTIPLAPQAVTESTRLAQAMRKTISSSPNVRPQARLQNFRPTREGMSDFSARPAGIEPAAFGFETRRDQ
ncbi:MAG: hypothetical protein ACYDCL_12455 [Myxococcales bacterium]